MVKESGNVDRAGDEVDKDHRKVINELVDNQGWSYDPKRKGGYPMLYPPDGSAPIRVPKTGNTKGRTLKNWLAAIKRAGGVWPPKGA